MCKSCLMPYYSVDRAEEAEIAALPEVQFLAAKIEAFYRLDPDHTDMGGPIHVVVYDTNVGDSHMDDLYDPTEHGLPAFPDHVNDEARAILRMLKAMPIKHRAVACAYAEVT